MFIKRTLLTLMTLFMAVSGMPVYAEKAPAPEVTEQKDDAQASAEMESVLGIKKLYAEEPSMLATGKEFNAAIKTLAAGTSKAYNTTDSLIQSVQVVDTRPSGSITIKDVSANNDGSYLAWWDAGTHTIKLYSESGDVILNPDSGSMFSGCSNLTTLDVSGWNTSQVTNMRSMFNGCSKLITLDVSGWDTSRVTNMYSMFQDCSSLTTLDVSKWNTSLVTNMGSIFGGCRSLTTLDVSGWGTSQVTNMGWMFKNCASLKTLDVSNWSTGKVTSMDSMFSRCNSLTTLDVSNWNTSKVTGMNNMFYNCSNLTTLDLSGWDTSQVTDMGYMFYKCSKLTTIYIGSNWSTSNVTSSSGMFNNCTKLPNFDASAIDKTHANALPDGYLLMKNPNLRYLAKSSFVLSGTSDYGTAVNTIVMSDKNGRMSFKNLEKGTYTLTEVSPTDGYIKNSVKYTVTVTEKPQIRRCCSMNRTMHLQFRRLLRQTPPLGLQVPNSCCLVFRITERKSARPGRLEVQELQRSTIWKQETTCLPRPKPRSIMHWIRFQEWCRLTSTESLRLTGSPKKEVPSYGQIFGMRMER